jgi:transcriptional regulator with GAF, ATPase, and Fis domain
MLRRTRRGNWVEKLHGCGDVLFLDEVGDIPLDLQPKLLRALQEKAFESLGGTRTIPIDVRLVAATNRNLTQMMGDKLLPQRSLLPAQGGK